MSNFIKTKSRKTLLNKKKLSKQVNQANKHDGENWSLLATGREIGLEDDESLELFGKFIVSEFDEGYEANSFNGHTLFTKQVEVEADDPRLKPDLIPFECYIKPVGTPKEGGGFDTWDCHINNNTKELFINYIKTLQNG